MGLTVEANSKSPTAAMIILNPTYSGNAGLESSSSWYPMLRHLPQSRG